MCAEAHGFTAIVCCLDERGALAELLETARVRVLVEKRSPGVDAMLAFRLASLLKRERVTAVHTHSLDPMLYAGCAAKLAGIASRVHTQHDTFLGRLAAERASEVPPQGMIAARRPTFQNHDNPQTVSITTVSVPSAAQAGGALPGC